jgi:hypothetical protein
MNYKEKEVFRQNQDVYINVIDIKKSEVIAKIQPFKIIKEYKIKE